IYKKLCLVGSIKNFEDLDEILDFGFDLLMNRYRNILADYASIGEKEIEDLQYQQFLEKFAEKRRFLKKGGILDLERAKQTFMKDLVDGKIGRVIYELPEDVIG
ncbi:MAG: ribosome biosis GTPase, partial [Thermotogaceae bacterium]|nr:ribosome biosis GTPase [Thermotogaceae bacterium]